MKSICEIGGYAFVRQVRVLEERVNKLVKNMTVTKESPELEGTDLRLNISALSVRTEVLETLVFDYFNTTLGSTPAHAAESCQQIKQLGQDREDGVYYVNPLGRGLLTVYCDMTTLGGGWTLILNQISSHYYKINDGACTAITGLNVSGTQCGLHKIFSLVNEIRYSDETNVTFLHAKLNGIHYWNAVSQKEFLDTSNGLSTPVEVVYVSGPLSGAKHYIEANGRFHWGHRNNYAVTRGKLTGLLKYEACKHVCWEDVFQGFEDRPFAGDHCGTSTAFCPATGPPYNFPSTAGRHGTFKFRKWVR
jgi:hypothetical protein